MELQGGYTLSTHHLLWSDANREVRSDDPVRMSGHGIDVTGRGLVARLDQEEVRILHDVHVRLLP